MTVNGVTVSNSNINGIGKTDEQSKVQSTYSDAVIGDGLGGLGWDFINVWKMPSSGGYPILKWQK
jgi:hypothetical protein